MAFDAGSIVARMVLRAKEFLSGLSVVEKRLGKFAAIAAGAFATNQIEQTIRSAVRLGQQFLAAAENGAKMEEVDAAFGRIVKSASEANNILKGTRRVTAALANNEIKQLANRLELVGIGAEKLPRLAEIAEAIGDATGESTKEILESIVTAGARMSDRAIAAIGLNIDLAKATDLYALSVGKAADELTDAEKQQVLMNELLDKGDTIITRLNDNLVSNADRIDTAKTAWANFFEVIDKGLAKIGGAIAGTVGTPRGLAAMILGPLIGPAAMQRIMMGGMSGGGGGRDFTDVLTGASFRSEQQKKTAAAALAAQVAAKAYFDSLLASARHSKLTPQSDHIARVSGGGMASLLALPGIEQGDVSDPGLSMGDAFVQNFINPIGDAINALGDSFSSFFEEIVTGSGQAGRAFFSGMMSGLAGVASNIGDLFIQTAIGMMAIPALNPFALIGAGFALKALAGMLRGVGNKNAPTFSTATAPRRPRGDQFEDQRAQTTIVVDNFIGGESLIEFINKIQRNTGARIVVHGRA